MREEVVKIMDYLKNNVFIFEEKALDKKIYRSEIERYYGFIKEGFEIKEFREFPVVFRFKRDSPPFRLQLRHFLTNLMLWEPLVYLEFPDTIDETYIYNCRNINSDALENYFNQKIILPFRREVANSRLNKAIDNVIFNLSRISADFNIILGLSLNIETFIDLSKRNQRFNEILRTQIPEDMQPSQVEEHLKDLTNEQMSILVEEDTLLRPMIKAKSGIKSGQLKEALISGGYKPDLDGKTIPILVNSNFVVGGLQNVIFYYIDGMGGRKAAIMNKTAMGQSGYFSRKLILLSTPVRLSKDVIDCGSVHPIRIRIRSKEHLKKLKGRNYRTLTSIKYSLLKGDEDHLIGKEILLRSPITCASKDICKTCYGDLYYINRDIESVGAYAATVITEPIGQRVLSAKHLLETVSEFIKFPEIFNKFFDIVSNEITLKNSEELELSDYSLLIIKENIHFIEEYGENEFNNFTYIFHVKNKKTGEIIDISDDNMTELYLSNELLELMNWKKNREKDIPFFEIPFNEIGIGDKIFVAEISNNELTKPLYDIMYLLDNQEKRGDFKTADDVAQRMLDLLIESHIDADSIHGETILRSLVRSKADILNRPNFKSNRSRDDYQVLTVRKALLYHPSVTIALSFQYLTEQFFSPSTFKKVEPSFIDAFYREKPKRRTE